MRIVSLLMGLFLSGVCFSQNGIIKGYVHDVPEDAPLIGATVMLLGEEIEGKMSDGDGDFIFEGLQAGSYDLVIKYLGKTDSSFTNIEVPANGIVEVYVPFNEECDFPVNPEGICPHCKKSDQAIPVIYGLPAQKLIRDEKKGKVKLGGCVLTGCDPDWYCKRDQKYF